ncbi:MAG: hypothetical protein N3G78_05835 [Desulfobacterota bacterium]|nr:hypothetical protein [Thermodesulfobacteriota bacterium]
MSFGPLCPYYDDAKCLLNNHLCDLDCGQSFQGRKLGSEGMRPIKTWSQEEWEWELKRRRVRPLSGYEP